MSAAGISKQETSMDSRIELTQDAASPARPGVRQVVVAIAWVIAASFASPPVQAQFAPPIVYTRDKSEKKASKEKAAEAAKAERSLATGLHEQVSSRLAELAKQGDDFGCSTLAQSYCSTETCDESVRLLRDYRDGAEGAARRLAQFYPGTSRMHTTCIGWMMDWPQVDGPGAREIQNALIKEGNSGRRLAAPPPAVGGEPGNAARAASTAQGSLRQKLSELQEARDEGLLTEQEFETLRQNILSRF
jgi:hypothetical protein